MAPWLVFVLACANDQGLKPHHPTTPDDTAAPGVTDPLTFPTYPDVGTLLFNEIVPGNESTYQLLDGTMPDWVELYNPGPMEVDLSVVKIANDAGAIWEGQTGTLPIGGFLVLAADGIVGIDHLPFTLSKGGDHLQMSVGGNVRDDVRTPDMNDDNSYARFPDGADTWATTIFTTPGVTNGDAGTESTDPRDSVVQDQTIHQIHYSITPQQMGILNTANENWAFVGMNIDGFDYPKINIRLKGSASFDLMDGKPEFKVDVNDFDPAARFRELKAFQLHNGNVLDPTRTRDYLTYQLARESGLMAPRVGWAEVYFNDTYYGIYMMIEGYDDNLIDLWYPGQGDLGALFEPNQAQGGGFGWGDLCTGDDIAFDYESGPLPPDPMVLETLNKLSRVCSKSATDANLAEAWTYVDYDKFLTYMAWENLPNHTDGYKAVNNWRVYVDTSYKVSLVPSGAEWTWDFTPSTWSFTGELAAWCLQNDTCKRDYAAKCLEMADRVEDLDLYGQFLTVSAWLSPVIAADPRSPHSPATVASARASSADHLQNNPGTVRGAVCSLYGSRPGCTPPGN
jgi:hypothetical protein